MRVLVTGPASACFPPWGPSCLSFITSLASSPVALVYATGVMFVWVLLGMYLNRPSFRENLCGSPSGDTKKACVPAADHVHPWDSLVGSDTRVRLDHGTIIARVNPRAPLRVRSPTLLIAVIPPAVNGFNQGLHPSGQWGLSITYYVICGSYVQDH